MAGIGWPEILIVLVIVVVIFGVGKVADVGPALGKAISGFKRAVKDGETVVGAEAKAATEAVAAEKKD